jgi:hypothetical protein
MEAFKMNVIDLEAHRDHDAQSRDRDVLESMWQGIAMSRHATLANLATEVADLAPLQFLKILSRFVEPPTNNEK